MVSVIFTKNFDKASSNQYCGLETSNDKMCKMQIAQNADSTEKLVLSRENTLVQG